MTKRFTCDDDYYKGLILKDNLTNEILEEEGIGGYYTACNKLNEISGEVEDLKQFKKKVFTLLNKYLEEYPYLTLTEKWDTTCKYKESCRKNHQINVAYASRNTLIKELIKELEE